MRELLVPSSGPSPVVHSPHHPFMQLLDFGIIVIGAVTAVLALYKLISVKCCRPDTLTDRPRPPRAMETSPECPYTKPTRWSSLPSFKYEKQEKKDEECAVCLSVFEQGDEVKRLPNCKHVFHAPCIDMWRTNCPLCRSPAGSEPDP